MLLEGQITQMPVQISDATALNTLSTSPPAGGAAPISLPAPPPSPEQPKASAPEPATRNGNEDMIIVTGRAAPPPEDPLQGANRVSFEVVQTVDKAVIGPITQGYRMTVPEQARHGIHNFLNNLNEPIVFVNFILQLNPARAAETVARFAVNSTLGVAGLVDMAKRKPFRLPRRSNGLADTLGFYGISPGPYLFLPLIGSTTVRDMLGRSVDLILLPATIGKPFNRPDYQLVSSVVSALDERSEFDEELRKIRESGNPYAAMRDYYLKRRAGEIATLHALKHRHMRPPPPETKLQEKQADVQP